MQVVAFSGLIVAVIGANIKFLEDILDNQHRRLVMVGLTATLAVLVVACLVSLLSLMGRLRTAQSKTEEIQERWGEFSEDPRANRAELLAMVADSLIGKPGGPSTAIIEIRDAADRREFRTRTAAALLCVGVLVMAAALFGVLAWR
ncbi:hypothetical protein SAMN05421812_11629 [Asanoa hainanensis]|uniref:Uncharacterized protein n=2 Tax=Asanoa hainanensis TaxID=560556 RepID=A0A239PBF7_9ACTN|nr:hypothetical protein SAMN05421812_11629 [Asanoa hainanensis]